MKCEKFKLTRERFAVCELGSQKGGAVNCTGKAELKANGKKVCSQCAFYVADCDPEGVSVIEIMEHAEDGERR